jgi:hypothetical protein
MAGAIFVWPFLPVMRYSAGMFSLFKRQGDSLRMAWVMLICLLAPVAGAIPLELNEPGFTLTLPEGFKEVPGDGSSAETRRLFMRTASPDGSSNVSLTIRWFGDKEKQGFDEENAEEGAKIIGRYSERLNNQDIDVLVAQATSNDALSIHQSATVPLDRGAILFDLRTHTEDDKAAQALMRKLIQSLAVQSRQTEEIGVQGWRSAIAFLVMGALVLVVAVARR